jgi:aryl-phospho-beta-D-glucosidase BglC (GH1 family)
VWDKTWGHNAQQGTAPIWIGEFGTPNGRKPGDATPPQNYMDPNTANAQGAWFTYLVEYIKKNNIHWCYWALNGTQSEAPTRNPALPDHYGVLAPDWQNVASQPLINKLQTIQ